MIAEDTQSFFLLLQLAIGKRQPDTIHISEKEWHSAYDTAIKQSLVGVIIEGIQKIAEKQQDKKPPRTLLYDWIARTERIKHRNKQMDGYSAMLTNILKDWGYDSCILKGQGVARLYPKPELRQSGDIDIWVNGNREEIVEKLKEKYINLSFIDYVNCHAKFLTDAEVEVHFRPTWMYNPFTNRKVQKWIETNKVSQMANYDKEVKFSYPKIEFNLVFSLIHIYRHVFQEGIGLRQLMDYYYILTHSDIIERAYAYETLCSFGMRKFAASVMHVIRVVFGIEESLLLCKPNVVNGDFLLGEIIRGGNFGHYDDRNNNLSDGKKIRKGIDNMKRNVRFIEQYPSEVLWMPIWKMWHWGWRKWKRYL